MNLKEVTTAIETIPNVIIALDLGTHQFCDFDSNCPKAIQLRQLITEAGINMGQILQGYATQSALPTPEAPITVETLLPNLSASINGNVPLSIMGHTVNVDITTELRESVDRVLRARLSSLDNTRISADVIGKRLYHAYQVAIEQAKQHTVVEQIAFPIKDLLEMKIISTSNRDGGYELFIPVVYQPEYIIDNGIRSKIHPDDIKLIRRDNVFLQLSITRSDTFSRIALVKTDGSYLNHYHGNSYDCWGDMRLPAKWDRTVRQLLQIGHERMGALGTVNMNSILSHQPAGMPSDRDLKARAIRMGREGEVSRITQPDNPIPPIIFERNPDGTFTGEITEPRRIIRWGGARS